MIYRVQDPQGQVHEIEGPEGASPDEVMKQAQSLIPPASKEPKTAWTGEPVDAEGRSALSPMEQIERQRTQSPVATATDPTLDDYLTVSGIGGLGKAAAGKAGKVLAPELERMARNQTMKGFGGSMSQIRQMSEKGGLDEAARYANEKGFNDIFSTSLGRENLLKQLESESGKKIGALREQAGTVLNPGELESKIMGDPKLEQYLGQGLESGQKADIPKALNDINRIAGPNPTYAERANAATFLNKSASGNKLYQPTGATSDVANILSRENNAGIRSSLGPDKAAEYDEALGEFSQLQPLKHLQERGELREMSGSGVGGFYGDLKRSIGNTFGHRGLAKAAYAGADVAGKMASQSVGGVTTHLMKILAANPASLGQYAAPLLKAAQTGGNQGLAATHYILSLQHPEYNSMIQGDSEQP